MDRKVRRCLVNVDHFFHFSGRHAAQASKGVKLSAYTTEAI
jgi:hypothetical protein